MVIKTASLTLKNLIQQTHKVSGEITEFTNEIIREIQQENVTIQYIFRENNQIADYLANLVIISTDKEEFSGFAKLPTA